MTGDVTKLPKWAQREIDRLSRDLASAYETLNAGPEDSDTFSDDYSDKRQPLGRGVTVAFVTGERIGERFRVRLDGDKLLVSGGDSLAIIPQASNSIALRMVRL